MSLSDRREWLQRMGTWGSEMIFGAEILVRIYGINGTIRSGSVASALRTSEIRIRHAGYKDRRKRQETYRFSSPSGRSLSKTGSNNRLEMERGVELAGGGGKPEGE